MESSQEGDGSGFPKPVYIRNCPFLNLPEFDREKIESVMDFESKDGDIILCTYPKTGTTWTQYIIWQILYKAKELPTFQDMSFKCFPFMEMTGVEAVDSLPSPRTYKNHLPYGLMKINKNAKYVYVHRNPMDTVVSGYHFLLNVFKRKFTFEDFFESFISGEIGYGDFFDHVLSFDLHKDEPHLLILSYEDLHKDARLQILKIAKFLGEEYHKALIEDEALLQQILETTSFSYMKKHLDTNVSFPGRGDKKEDIRMFRKGIVGEGEIVLSSEQKERLHQKMLSKMKGTSYVQLWSSE